MDAAPHEYHLYAFGFYLMFYNLQAIMIIFIVKVGLFVLFDFAIKIF